MVEVMKQRRGSYSFWMILPVLMLAIFLVQPREAVAQWATNGNNINNTNTGNVGIGTTAPASKLEVSGGGFGAGMLVTDSNTTGTTLEVLNTSANQRWRMQAVGNAVAGRVGNFELWNVNNTVLGLAVQPGGNVGIGTASPAAKLAVTTNTASATSTFTITPDGTNNYYASNNHDALFIDGSQTSPHGLYTSAVFRLFHIKASTGFDTLSVSRGGDMVVSPETRLATYALKLAPDASNSYYAGTDYDILQVSGVGLGNHGMYTGKTVRLVHVTNAAGGDAFVMSREGNATFGGDLTIAGNIAAKYQDVAEWVPANKMMPAGTVVVLDKSQSNQVQPSFKAYDTRVAGVVSAQPGIALGEGGANKVLVATTGRVKVKVDARAAEIEVGDLLVTSDVEGVATKSVPMMIQGREFHSPGTLIGKALEPMEKGKTGEILVLLSLQ
jgi:hypothetical protein